MSESPSVIQVLVGPSEKLEGRADVEGSDRPNALHVAATGKWLLLQRVLFRWVAIYLVLYCLPFPLNILPGGVALRALWAELWQAMALWAGEHVLGIRPSITVLWRDSSDTTVNYLQLFVAAMLATVGCAAWSLIDRRGRAHARARDIVRVYLRYFVAYQMFGYGFNKVFDIQFVLGGSTLSRMLETYGESSPLSLFWTFMGSSTPYTVFAGIAETTIAALLLFRRTATLGAVLGLPIIGNVVLLDYCYDVPAKLIITHLFLMVLVLLVPDVRRLAGAAIGYAVPAAERSSLVGSSGPKWRRAALHAVKVVLVLLIVVPSYLENRNFAAMLPMWRTGEKPGLYGVYEVEPDSQPGDVSRVVIDESAVLAVFRRNGNLERFQIGVDGFAPGEDFSPPTLSLEPYHAEGARSQLDYRRAEGGRLILEGKLGEESASLRLRKLPLPRFLLKEQKFRWISEYPNFR